MKIIIKSKGRISGYISSSHIPDCCLMSMNYSKSRNFVLDLQRLLLKHKYDLSILSGEGNVGSKYILKSVRNKYKTDKRGNSYHNIKRRKNDKIKD